MSEKPEDGQPDEAEGGSLPPNPEMEELAREAAASVEEIHQSRDLPDFPAPPGEAEPEPEPEATEAEESDEVLSLRKELEELTDRHTRLQADFENQRRRTLKERQEAHQYGHENLVKDLLATVDNLDRAIDHASNSSKSDDEDFQGMLQGVELVRRELLAAFAKHGVSRLEALNEAFDPNFHEAMAQQESDEVPANTVVQVFQTGYKLRDRLLRPARVVVSKPGAGEAVGAQAEKAEGSEEEAGS